jgi:RHS repeat-associated protein
MKVEDSGNATSGFANGNTSTDDYAYDVNGNMSQDKNKGIDAGNIRYNFLNLPRSVRKSGSDSLAYVYDATGRKLRQQVYGATAKITDYIQELVYENDALQFLNHEEGRVIMTGTPEYQYHLKDHLGNVRVTFTSVPPPVETYSTNFEAGSNSNFNNYSTHNFDLVDHTDEAGTTYTKTQLLNGTGNYRVGIAKSFSVMPGDVITAGAWMKYMNLSSTANPNVLINSLAAAFGVSSGSTGEALKAYNGLNTFAGTVAAGDHPGDNEGAPKAFATILLFDKDYNLIDAAWDQVTTTGEQTSPSTKQPPHDHVQATLTARSGGYAYVFLSNEHPTLVDVYFDDATFSVTPTPVVSVNDYYPFGLTFNSYQRESSVENKNLYQSWELQDELNLNTYSTEFRNYDPAIGRWMQIDPKASERESPYVGMANNPIRYIDPLGDTIRDNNGIVANYRTYVTNRTTALQGMLADENFNFAQYGTTREAVAGLVAGLQGIGGELDAMQASEQVYNVGFSNDMAAGEGGMSFNAETGEVNISFGRFGNFDQAAGLVGHEMLHGYQFETGKVSMRQDNAGYGALYDIGDETAAYQREHLVAGGIGSGAHINNQWTRNFGASMNPPAYQTLPAGSIDINSPQGMYLRMNTSVDGMLGRPAREAYKGWRGHYNQGARNRVP